MDKKGKMILITSLCAFAALVAIISARYYFDSYNWKYRDIIRKWRETPYGYAIVRVNVALLGDRLFSIWIAPNELTREEAFELGKDMADIWNKELEADEKGLFRNVSGEEGGKWRVIPTHIFIHNEPTPRSEADYWVYSYEYPGRNDENAHQFDYSWIFSGDLGNGRVYERVPLDSVR